MDDNQEEGVFQLITNLCEKFYTHPYEIKVARAKCYEILLGKRLPHFKNVFKDLKGTTDPFCNLSSWQFQLTHTHNLRDHALTLQEPVDKLKILYEFDTELFKNILQFLLSLRNLPTKDRNKLDLSSLPPIEEYEHLNTLFKLPTSILKECGDAQEQKLVKESKDCISIFNSKLSDILNDEGYISCRTSPDENIWELVSKMKYSTRRNWENYGYSEPDKERLFLSELGDLSSLWVENLESLYLLKLFRDGTIYNSKMVPRKIFIKHLKYLLVGMASECFQFNDKGEFYLIPGITVEGITPDSLKTYCRDFLFCGTCYKALNKISSPSLDSDKYRYDGYIFKEFCDSIIRYLKFYQTAVFNIPDSTNYLQFFEKTYQLQLQISVLASICKVGPGMEPGHMPHGVALLNYFYQKVLTLTDQKLITVLYSILYPCCQVYFSRFLQQWILEGVIDDPYGEFFIKVDSRYMSTRGRAYWTRSYTLRQDIVPDFLSELKTDVLNCGKSMNLLKFCHSSSNLCQYLMGKKHPIISCCLTLDQLTNLQQIVNTYYLDVCLECGPRFKWKEVLEKSQDNPALQSLIAKKRAATLRRLELERHRVLEEERLKKNEEIMILREQYAIAIEQKQCRIAKEIEAEMKQVEDQFQMELKRQKLVQEEANKMIEFYSELFKIADNKKIQIENHIRRIKSIQLDHIVGENADSKIAVHKIQEDYPETVPVKDKETQFSILEILPDQFTNRSTETSSKKSSSSSESFYSVCDEEPSVKEKPKENEGKMPTIYSSESMDLLNANTSEISPDDNANLNPVPPNIQQAIDNFKIARKNKEKVMFQELHITYNPDVKEQCTEKSKLEFLTQAQRNKLRVLSSEFDIAIKPETFKVNQLSQVALNNRNKVLGVSDCFEPLRLDNENFFNKNIKNVEEATTKTGTIKKSQSLMLDLDKSNAKSRKAEFDRPIPMSVDSTPMSDLPQSTVTTPSTMFMSVDTNPIESIPNTADTQQTDEGFNFNSRKTVFAAPNNNMASRAPRAVFSKRVTQEEAAGISTNCLKLFLHQSVEIPLLTQNKLVNDELLKYFMNDLEFLKHLNYLRDYFFLQDGEFSRTITDKLFTKLYSCNLPFELINCRTLQEIIFSAIDMSSKHQNSTVCLSFKINNLPKSFNLRCPNVLDCLSLTYAVKWPLNILLPSNAIEKYEEVFKFLLKLNRMSWVLKNIFLDLKLLAKENGKKEIYLMSSPQYKKLHQYRHIMTHFIQSLQHYVVGEVLQPSWEILEKNLLQVSNLDELYVTHSNYIKTIRFKCLMNQKTGPLRTLIYKIFQVILKFFDYIRRGSWTCEDGIYVHSNFDKLKSIFHNFQEIILFFFKSCKKVAASGYQPHLFQLLSTLDINCYLSNQLQRQK